ncbi:hypothetical protein AA103196_2616 [Ameyamaea chiangmaiensis NBRC 103196]|nr:hypothetical protein AA103196_2616 [Ameyamaea chiangmaiensis NBRC 103196]
MLALTGVGIGVPGTYLAVLGGSWYYMISGVVLVLASVLVWRRRLSGLWLYMVFFTGTILWSLWEVGMDAWALMPRLAYFAFGAMWLMTPWVRRSLYRGQQ